MCQSYGLYIVMRIASLLNIENNDWVQNSNVRHVYLHYKNDLMMVFVYDRRLAVITHCLDESEKHQQLSTTSLMMTMIPTLTLTNTKKAI